MKQILLKSWLVMVCLMLGVGTGWADSYKITFKTGSNDGSSVSTSTKCSDIVSAGSDFLDGNVATATKAYSAGSSGLKLGTSSDAGTIKMNLSSTGQVSATTIVVKAKRYSSSKATKLAVNGKTAQNLTAEFADYTFTLNSNITYLELVSSKGTSGGAYCWIESITVNYNSSTPDTRTAVNMTAFTADKTTLIKDETTNTSVTNDQNGWTAAYTYESSNASVATVSNDGVITAVAKGTARITATLNIANDDENWKKGATASKSIDITVNNPSHNYTFISNNTTVSSGSCEEGAAITFPEDPSIDGVTFMGWATAAIDGTQDNAPTMYKSANMGTNNVEYYAVFAIEEGEETTESFGWEEATVPSNWVIGGTITRTETNATYYANSGSYYGLLGSTSSVQYKNKVRVKSFSYNCVRRTANTNTSIKIETSTNGTSWTEALSTTWNTFNSDGKTYKKIEKTWDEPIECYVRVNIVTAANRQLDDISITYGNVTYSDYCTTVSLDPKPTIVLSATELAEYAGNTNTSITASVSEGAYTGALTVESSAEAVATASIVDGKVQIQALTAGTATLTVTAPAVTGFRKNTATIAVTVSEKLAHGLAFDAEVLNLTVGQTEITEPTLSNPNSLPVVYSLVYATPANEGKVATINAETGKITLADPSLSTETQGAVTVKASTIGDNSHAAGEVTYNLVVARKVTTTSWSNEGAAVNIDKDEIATLPTASNDGERNLFYESSNTEVATIDGTGAVTFVAYGTTTITAKTNATAEYAATSATYELTFAPRYTVTFNVNGKETVLREETSGAGVTAPAVEPVASKVFCGWAEDEIDGTTDDAPTFVSTTSLDGDKTLYAVFADVTLGDFTTTTDVLSRETTGVEDGATSYSAWSNKTATSDAVYAGNSAGSNDAIQLRSSNNNSGIITTASGGVARKVVVTWQSNTVDGRTLNVYGKNTAYTSVEEAYGENKGTPLGTIVKGTSTTLNITGNYEYVAFVSDAGAMYISSISIDWENGTPDKYSNYCTTVAVPTATINIATKEGFATFVCKDAIVMPEGVEGSSATVEGGKLSLAWEYQAGDVVPAATPILVKGTKGDHTANITTGGTTPAVNLLVANMTGEEEDAYILANDADAKCYVLSYDKNHENLGFYWKTEIGDGDFKVPAGKVFLALPNGVIGAPAFRLFDDETAIENLKNVETENVILYNIQGQRVNANAKGIVIKNGKKYFVK